MKTSRYIISMLVAGWVLCAQPGPPMGGLPPVDEVKTYLTLTDAQIQSLQQLRQQEAETAKGDMDTIRAKQTALRTAVNGNDAATAGRLLLEIEALRKRGADTHTQYRTQAIAVLTAAQKTKLTALQDALKLQPAIGQALGLNLLTPPDPPANAPRGMGPMPFGGQGEAGFGPGPGPRRFGPPPARE